MIRLTLIHTRLHAGRRRICGHFILIFEEATPQDQSSCVCCLDGIVLPGGPRSQHKEPCLSLHARAAAGDAAGAQHHGTTGSATESASYLHCDFGPVAFNARTKCVYVCCI